jgi:hypothetical protein
MVLLVSTGDSTSWALARSMDTAEQVLQTRREIPAPMFWTFP